MINEYFNIQEIAETPAVYDIPSSTVGKVYRVDGSTLENMTIWGVHVRWIDERDLRWNSES